MAPPPATDPKTEALELAKAKTGAEFANDGSRGRANKGLIGDPNCLFLQFLPNLFAEKMLPSKTVGTYLPYQHLEGAESDYLTTGDGGGNRRVSGYGGHGHGGHGGSGYGGGGYGHSGGYGGGKKLECCELVVDPLTFFSLLGFIAFATAFLNVLVTMNIMMRRRRRKRDDFVGCEDDQGKVVWQQAMDAFHAGTERLLIGQISNWGSEKSM